MRNEEKIYGLFMDIAKADDRILAAYMNGSRTNPNVPRDIFQDYDIVYVVRETGTFIEDKNWIHRFGKILYMQYPDENPYYPCDKENNYGWLMQFEDGVRIDLTVQTIYRWLDADEYQGYLNTYFGGSVEEAWTAVLHMCDLFEQTTEYVGHKLGYTYNLEEGKAAREFLERVRKLPKVATSV